MDAIYDLIGIDYSDLRRPDVRIAALIDDALGSAETVLNIGAGAGSYEPAERDVMAVEPSEEMIRQRSPEAAPALQGQAENLPFSDDSFDASMAILTLHHWTGKQKGLAEMRRVTRDRIVLLTFDPACRSAWLNEYFPELVTLDEAQMPPMAAYAQWLGPVEVVQVPIPHNCTDGFLYAYWRRPAAYLDPKIRTGMSSFWSIENAETGLARLSDDLETGVWKDRYGDLLEQSECDLGYRLVIAG